MNITLQLKIGKFKYTYSTPEIVETKEAYEAGIADLKASIYHQINNKLNKDESREKK